ncbi:D-inositol 3-phosphate glycosyltransferase [compost metagenome]
MTIALICNSLNPDLIAYFRAKLRIPETEVGAELLWFCNGRVKLEAAQPVRTSSLSPASGFSAFFFVDCLLSVYVLAVLLWKRARTVIFDTAHISNLPLALGCKLFGIEIVFTIHDWEPHPGPRNRATCWYNQACRDFLADRFIVFSRTPAGRVPTTVFRLSGFEPRPVREGRGKYFLFFGRIEPYKGLSSLLEIATLLERRLPDHEIRVAGKGSDPALAPLAARPNVRVINRFIEQAELDDLFGGAIATLLPYQSATQSGVAVLSYAYGTPVVAFDVGALGEYIERGHSGELVRPGDLEDFVAQMMRVEARLPDYEAYIRRGFEERYGVSALVSQYAGFLRGLVQDSEGLTPLRAGEERHRVR